MSDLKFITLLIWFGMWSDLSNIGYANTTWSSDLASRFKTSTPTSQRTTRQLVLTASYIEDERTQTFPIHQEPEVQCPEFCVCSKAENSLNCNGDHIFSFPVEFPTYNFSRVLLQHFAKNDLRSVDMSAVTRNNTRDLTEVRIPRNGISVIKNTVFAGLNGLKRLDLSANKLSQITNLTFIGLSSLLYLDLSSNRIAAIDPGSFAYLRDLIQLELSSNKLSYIPNDLFSCLHSLQYLNLEVNQIKELEANSLVAMPQLVHLNLALNPLDSVEKVTFEQTHLQYCDFSHCNMRTIPENLPPGIHDIRLSGNKLGNFSAKRLHRYTSLTILVLDDCHISYLEEDSFEGLTSVQRLWLNGNHLDKVPARLPSSLKALYLDENNIKSVWRKDVEKLVDLEELHLQRNHISAVEACAFCEMHHLHFLDLRGNRLQMLNYSLLPSENSLSTLDLSLNPLRVIGVNFFSQLSSLRQIELSRVEMDISDQLINSLNSANFSFPHVTSLDISGNPKLAEWFFKLIDDNAGKRLAQVFPNLHTLNIRNCAIAEFPANLEPFFMRLSKIKLGQNPVICDLTNNWLIKMIQSQPQYFYKPAELKCGAPKPLRFQKIVSIRLPVLKTDSNHQQGTEIDSKSIRSQLKVTHRHSLERLPMLNSGFYTPMWTFILVTCLLAALLLVLLLIYLHRTCSFKMIKVHQFSVRQKLCGLLPITHDPFPELAGSTRTLYSTSGDSIYTINTEVPPLAPSNEMVDYSYRNISVKDDDEASVSSAFHSYREFLV